MWVADSMPENATEQETGGLECVIAGGLADQSGGEKWLEL